MNGIKTNPFLVIYRWLHLLFNLLVQVLVGLPLEMVHGSMRIGAVYMAGVLAGELVFFPDSHDTVVYSLLNGTRSMAIYLFMYLCIYVFMYLLCFFLLNRFAGDICVRYGRLPRWCLWWCLRFAGRPFGQRFVGTFLLTSGKFT